MAAKKKSKNAFLLLFALFGILLIVVNGALAFMLLRPSGDSNEKTADPSAVTAQVTELKSILSIDSFVVNLNEPGAPRYLRLAISLELNDERSKSIITDRMIPFRDRLIAYLSHLDANSLRSTHDKERLRLELINISKELFQQDLITNIYFTEFIIQ